jgi:hypothetical protein
MLDLAQAVREQIVKETPPRRGTPPKTFSFRGLKQMALWGATAAGALSIAVLATRGNVSNQRLAAAFRVDRAQVETPGFDPAAETRRLAEAVRNLSDDDEQMKTRLAAVEHNMDDMTGSISKEIESADATRHFDDGPTVTSTATASLAAAASPRAPISASTSPLTPDATASASGPASTRGPAQYGVDIGSGLTITALRSRWASLQSAHAALFDGLQPIISVREMPHSTRIELRLVVGPFAQSGTATQFCKSLSLFGLFCQPTVFDGQRLALR